MSMAPHTCNYLVLHKHKIDIIQIEATSSPYIPCFYNHHYATFQFQKPPPPTTWVILELGPMPSAT